MFFLLDFFVLRLFRLSSPFQPREETQHDLLPFERKIMRDVLYKQRRNGVINFKADFYMSACPSLQQDCSICCVAQMLCILNTSARSRCLSWTWSLSFSNVPHFQYISCIHQLH